jgi:hypothetical protein
LALRWICLLILGLASPHGLVRQLLAVIVAETLIGLTIQFMVFMRTDVYFVLARRRREPAGRRWTGRFRSIGVSRRDTAGR